MINRNNYHLNSFGVFEMCETPKFTPDYISHDKSFTYYLCRVLGMHFEDVTEEIKIGYNVWKNSNFKFKVSSYYWFIDGYLIRKSNHWGKVRDCFWKLDNEEDEEEVTARCLFSDMGSINQYVLNNDDEYDLPIIEDGAHLAYEFGYPQQTIINKESRELNIPLIDHPNHRSNFIKVIDFDNK